MERKTLPGPTVSLAANPSAFSPSASLLSWDSDVTTRLFAGQSERGVEDAARPICRPVSRLKRVTVRSTTLLLPET